MVNYPSSILTSDPDKNTEIDQVKTLCFTCPENGRSLFKIPRIITLVMTRTIKTKESSSVRRPSWIQRDPFSITTAVTDPSAWPPHNPELVFDWNPPTVEFYKAEQQLQQHHSVSLIAPAFASEFSHCLSTALFSMQVNEYGLDFFVVI